MSVGWFINIWGHFHRENKFRLVQSLTKTGEDLFSLGYRVYVERCLYINYVAVGPNAFFIMLPHWKNMS